MPPRKRARARSSSSAQGEGAAAACRALADAVLALDADEAGETFLAFEALLATPARAGAAYVGSDPGLAGHPLYLCALLDLPRAAERLLARGASAAAPFSGESPLEAAARRASRRVLGVLLAHVRALETAAADSSSSDEGLPSLDGAGEGDEEEDDDDAGAGRRPPFRRSWTHMGADGRTEVRLHRREAKDPA